MKLHLSPKASTFVVVIFVRVFVLTCRGQGHYIDPTLLSCSWRLPAAKCFVQCSHQRWGEGSGPGCGYQGQICAWDVGLGFEMVLGFSGV